MKNVKLSNLAPVLMAFFVMGYVDMIGISANYVKADFGLSDTMTNLFGSLLFFWFLALSLPTGIVMNKIGRRRTVAFSVAATTLAMAIPAVEYSMAAMTLSFILLGMGNAALQVSINPLVADIIPAGKLASGITLGQFVKSVASFAAPIALLYGASACGNWRMAYPAFAAISLIAAIWLWISRIEESAPAKNSSFSECFALLRRAAIAVMFCGILVHVGIDVGVNITAPKILIDRAGMDLGEAGYATSLYFFFKTASAFAGAAILAKVSPQKFFAASVALVIASCAALLFLSGKEAIFACIALVGIGNANVFSVIFSRAMQTMPDRKNEISGLMVMGISGGGIFPLLMGVCSDAAGSQTGAIAVILACALYLGFVAFKMWPQKGVQGE